MGNFVFYIKNGNLQNVVSEISHILTIYYSFWPKLMKEVGLTENLNINETYTFQ